MTKTIVAFKTMEKQIRLLWAELRWINSVLREDPDSCDHEAHLHIRATIIDHLETLGYKVNQPLETPAGVN